MPKRPQAVMDERDFQALMQEISGKTFGKLPKRLSRRNRIASSLRRRAS